MRHLSWDEMWSYMDADPSNEPGLVEEHISQCPSCAAKLRMAQEASGAVTHVLRMHTPPSSPDADARLLQTLSGVTSSPSSRALRRRRYRIQLYPVFGAAAVVFIAGIGTYLMHMGLAGRSTASSGTSSMATSAASSASNVTAMSPKGKQDHAAAVATKQAAAQTGYAGAAVPTATLSVHIQSSSGHPLSGVNVAFIANGQILATGTTKPNGLTDVFYLPLPGDPTIHPSPGPTNSATGTAALVAWKAGYQPVVSYEVGLSLRPSGSIQTLTMNHSQMTNAVQVLPGQLTASSQGEAFKLYQWVSGLTH